MKRRVMGLAVAMGLFCAEFGGRAAVAEDAPKSDVKLVEPKPITAGHRVIALFPAGHPALHALAGADQDEKFTLQNGKVVKVNNIHVPTIEFYPAPADRANGTSVILS